MTATEAVALAFEQTIRAADLRISERAPTEFGGYSYHIDDRAPRPVRQHVRFVFSAQELATENPAFGEFVGREVVEAFEKGAWGHEQ